MFSEMIRSLRQTLALRLTLWYAGAFAASSIPAFVLVYALFVSIVHDRTDDDLKDDLVEFASFLRTGGLDRVRTEIAADAQGRTANEVFFLLEGPDGLPVIQEGISVLSMDRPPAPEETVLETIDVPGSEHRFRTARGSIGTGYVLEIGQSLQEDDEFIATFRNGFLITLAVVLLLAAPIGWVLARRALRQLFDQRRPPGHQSLRPSRVHRLTDHDRAGRGVCPIHPKEFVRRRSDRHRTSHQLSTHLERPRSPARVLCGAGVVPPLGLGLFVDRAGGRQDDGPAGLALRGHRCGTSDGGTCLAPQR